MPEAPFYHVTTQIVPFMWICDLTQQTSIINSWHASYEERKKKLHCKIIISDLVGFFLKSLMVKVWGQNSNRNTVKQTAENGQKISGDENVASITSLVPGVKNSRLWNGLEFDGAYKINYGRSRKWFRLITNISNISLASPCMKATWHHWRHKRSHMPFFYCLFDRLAVRILTLDHHHQILQKISNHVRA